MTHDVTCHDCNTLYACACSEPRNHVNWMRGHNVCPSCRRDSRRKWDEAAAQLKALCAPYLPKT
jgi:hypothetical protein